MKIDRNKLKKSSTEVPVDCRALIEKLKSASDENLQDELHSVRSWTYGKCELYHWSDILDRFDEVLEKGCKKESEKKWTLSCDEAGNQKLKELLLNVLHFTSLLIEHSFSRHLYNSMEHLTTLLSSCDMTVVLAVLNLLYVFSKRSNFITRLNTDKKQGLLVRLTHLAESWGGKENGFGLAECCTKDPAATFPASATTLHFEFYLENKEEKGLKKSAANTVTSIHMDNLDKTQKLPSEIMEELLTSFKIPEEKQMLLYTHIRLAHLFSNYEARVQCVQARLQALAILVYSNAIQETMNSLLYPGLIEELVDIVELKDDSLVEIKAASLRTLTSIIHLERNPKLNTIIDATGAASYHGFLPVLVRSCIQHMTDPQLTAFPQQYATALFSFLYHLASYENGVEALVSCGMMECLLKVISWYGDGQEHITQFVTRAVRVVDLITNLDMAAFQAQGGLSIFINRLEHEVSICRKEQPFEIKTRRESILEETPSSPTSDMETDTLTLQTESSEKPSEPSGDSVNEGASTSSGKSEEKPVEQVPLKTGSQCFPQRAALLKSMLNFLKKAIPDPSFSDSIRHLMEGSLPKSLRHIISNAEYYGPSLFLLATDVVTVYVFQEPSLLSSLQDSGLTDVVLHALLIKDVPATREVLASLPNVFSALCLNTRGLESFVDCKPFDRLFKVLLSQDYLPAMRRRRSSDPFGDTASNLGNAMDELMRHQPSLRTDATKAIIKLLEEVCAMGMDPKYICVKPTPKPEQQSLSIRSPQPPDTASSDEEDEEDDIPNTQESSLASKPSQESQEDSSRSATPQNNLEKQAIPLMDYVLNVMKFVEAILSNNSTDDHCREFVSQKGLQPLMSILGLPNLPIDFPASPACQAVAIVCKSILTLSREPQVLKQGLLKLEEVLQNLETLHKPLDAPGGSVLLRELSNVAHLPDSTLSPQATPLLHALSSCHAYIMMFVHVCRMGQVKSDIRFISVSHWGSDLGLNVLRGLSKLYTSLVWESTVLLALCSEDILPAGCEFGKADMEKLTPKDVKADKEEGAMKSSAEMGSNGVSAAMESLSTSENTETPMEVNENQQQSGQQSTSDKDSKKTKPSPTLQAQVKQMKPLLSVSSRLCRALAELFGLLVKLCVGSPVRQRRTQQIPAPPTTPSAPAQAVAKALTRLLTNGLEWTPPPCSPVPKLRLTFLVCSVGFTSMLFDEKKQPFHLMLQKFVSSGGQSALFEAFEWALSLGNKGQLSEGQEQSDLPDGTGEFLDAWLMLVEKMVNPKTILESTHTLPPNSTPGLFEPFTPVQYLISTQKAAFKAVMQLWNKTPLKIYGGRMSESILAILCHIVKGENIIREHLSKEKEETPEVAPGPSSAVSRVPATPSFRPAEIDVNPSHLQQLMDMGFTREHCMESLTHTTSLEQATDYILTHPPSTAASSNAGSSNQRLGMVMEMSEEDQMMQAIALSLGESVVMTTDQGQPSAAATTLEAQPEEQAPVPEANKPEEIVDKEQKENPLDKAVLDQFSDSVLPGCLTLLDTLPETVYRVCDLLIVVTQRNGVEWQKKVLSSLAEEIHCLGKQLLSNGSGAQKGEVSDTEKKETNTEASKFAARLHLFSLLFEEMMMPCAETLEHAYLIDLLVQVLNSGQEFLSVHKDSITPKWLAPLLLLLDLYEKVSVISKRKAEADKLLAESHTWKWFDDSSGRWCKYSISNNKAIDDAYRADENCVRFQVERGRRRYTINFISMVQVNEETGNRRPIMLTLPSVEEKQQSKEDIGESSGIDPTENKMETEALEKSEKKAKETVVVSGLNPDQITSITRSVVSLLNIPVEAECLHAALRLTLRLTRDHKFAILFAELGGPKLLLSLTQSSSFHGFISLATLIFRHILEEPLSLKYCMEKVVRKATSGSGSSASGVQQGTLGSKELHYVMRVLGPAACRSPHLFADVAKSALQIALPAPSKRDEDESRFTSPNAPQILKSVPMKQMTLTTVESPIKEVLYDLLDCLTVEYTENDESVSTGLEVQPPQTLAEAMAEVANETANLARQGSSADLPTDDQSSQDNGAGGSGKEQSKDKESKQEDVRKQRPLMPKSSVLRLLSEIVKSYSSCTQLITQYTYQTRQTTLVPEECTVLAFVLDNLLPHCQIFGDKDCPALSRVFIASIASCNHCPDAQMTLVGEIKGALQRALLLPESAVKHTRIRALTNLISVIIESCPSPGQVPNQVFKGQQSVMNNIVKSLLKKGLVTDLARIPHCLDLSSPYMASTVNSALKPLETLSRSVNQPAQGVIAKAKKSDIETTIQQATEPTELNTTVAETVAAPAESSQVDSVTIEDISNQVDQNNDLEETEPLDAVEPDMDSQAEVENELDEVLDVLLNRDARGNSGGPGLGDIVMDSEDISQVSGHDDEDHDPSGVIIDVAEDLDHHDSQMVSQAISIDEDDGDETAHDMHNDDESGSDADDDGDGDGDDDEDDDDDDDDDGDDDEEDEDDEGSDMEAEEEDEYHDIETSINTLNDYGDNFLMEDMFSMGGGAGQHVIFNALDNGHTMRNFGGFQLPISLHDNDNGNEDAVPNIPPAPSSVQPMHPLLVRQPDTQTVMGVQRLHRSRNQRGTCRYNPSTQTLHVNFPRQPNPPVILQRLLGPSTAADVLQLTSTLTSVAGPTPTRLVLANDDLRIISRPEEDLYDELFHDSYADNNPSGSGVLTSVPSTLARWTEEAKVLDGNSVHDCVTALKPVIIESLEKRRDEELAERREKRRKQTEEEAAKKEKGANADINKTVEWNTSQNMEISHTTEDTAGYVDSSVSAPSTTTLATSAVTPAATTSGRQISASEAAAAAELIATAVVEGILSTPAMATTATPSLQQQTESAQANAGSTAPTFLTPAQPMPIVSPMAPRFNRAVQRTSNPASTCNLASLLQHDAAEGETPIGETSMLSTSRASTDRHATAQDATVSGNQLSSDLAANQASLDGIITPEEVSGISSSDAVTIQSSESSEELNTGVDGPESTTNTAVSSSAEQASMVTDTLSSAYNILTPSSFSGDPVSVSALTSSMLGALSASISAPPSLLSSAHGLSIPTTGARASDSQPATASTAGPSGTSSSQGTAFGDLPEGVDPSFLAALPENIRQEVIAEQLRLQRIQQSAREQAQNARTTGSVEVNAEFLAALPPNIQEEVLAQQRTEQARIQAQQQSTTTASETPVDPASFLATLPSSLRQQVLADMDDSMVAVLPPDLAAEAQSLRRELEERHRRLMQERLFPQSNAGSLSAILRQSGFGGRLGPGRYAIRAIPSRGIPRSGSQWAWGSGRLGGQAGSNQNSVKFKGRHMLDHEALTCLLVLLFVDEPKLQTSRLHRVLRNLCYHGPTRLWVIRALLSILQKTGECKLEEEKGKSFEKGKRKGSTSENDVTFKSDTKSQGSWLSISLEASLGCRANVFQIQKSGKKHTAGNTGSVTVHQQASPVVCRHVLDTLIALAKVFPGQFLPSNKAKEADNCDIMEDKQDNDRQNKQGATPTVPSTSVSNSPKSTEPNSSKSETDFWDLLVKLDSLSGNRKGKSVQKTHSASGFEGEASFHSFDTSPIGQLMTMLSHPVIKRSQLLTDRLLRLLGLVSLALPDMTQENKPATSLLTTTSTPATITSGSANTLSISNSLPGVTPVTRSQGVTADPHLQSETATSQMSHEEKAARLKERRESQKDKEEEAPLILEEQLQLAVQVLTSKSCSEEGLEDATNLLLQLSWASNATRRAVLKLLLEGARVLGMTVCSHISTLLEELKDFGNKVREDQEEDKDMETMPSNPSKGVLLNRFEVHNNIVVAAPKKIKAGRELQLPSMTLLTSKTSSQQFFLRILKVITQLRDAVKTVVKQNSRRAEFAERDITEAMSVLQREAEAIMEMVNGRLQRNHNSGQLQQQQSEQSDQTEASSSEQQSETPASHTEPSTNSGPAAPSSQSSAETPMDVDQPGTSSDKKEAALEDSSAILPRLSDQLNLDELWQTLGDCLSELAKTPDHHAVLILQPAVEAFFIVHAGEKESKSQELPSQKKEDQLSHLNIDMAPASPAASSTEPPASPSTSDTPASTSKDSSVMSASSGPILPQDTQKFLKFAETHRTVLNQILRQSTTPLSDGPFSVLVDHTRILDFDVKRRYFRQELERLDEGIRREDLAVHVRREHVFEDSFRELFRRTADEWKHRFYIVFEGEEGQDAGGLLREWYIIISREIFNPMYALFRTSPGDRVTYTINPSSHCNSNHLSYYKFVGRIIAKAIYDNKLLECYFTRSFYKHIIGQLVKYTDMESEDYAFYQGLVFLLEHHVEDLGYDLTFSTEIQEFGVTEVRDMKPNGRNMVVTEENKKEYVKLVCQMKMTSAIKQQLSAFMEGFYDIIPKRLISIFNEQELELLISGLPSIDIDDLKANSEYHKYQQNSLQVQWFWRALRSFEQADRAKFLQFVTGTSKVPLQGFAYLEGMNGYQKFQIHRDDRSTDRLPVAHTCFNQLDLPAYETYDKLRRMLLLAINECSEGFGLA